MTLDREVPVQSRRLVGGALLYFLAPLDLLPEVFVGPAGYIDDLVLACIVVSRAMGPDLEAYATGHWSGSEELRRVLAQVTGAAESLLGAGLTARLKALLARRGIPL